MLRRTANDAYDIFKLFIWRQYFPQLLNKSHFVFVSQWMKEEFYRWVRVKKKLVEPNSSVIYNCVGEDFEKLNYLPTDAYVYDFITVRGSLDGSKYCIDLVNKLAFSNPDLKFAVVGKGRYFSYNAKAPNLHWINDHISHEDIISLLNRSRCALMPTRTDSQGVMACEMATFGIPVITSDIPVCHEIFDDFKNVRLMSNNIDEFCLGLVLSDLDKGKPYEKNTKYCQNNTCAREVALFQLKNGK